jgi:nucleoside-diphosphate-sugar epimerase
MKLKNVKFKFTGGVDGGRGWKGDVKNMLLDTSKIKALGWKPKHNTKQAVRKATKDLSKTSASELSPYVGNAIISLNQKPQNLE